MDIEKKTIKRLENPKPTIQFVVSPVSRIFGKRQFNIVCEN